jgi:hypothetical protein
VAGFLTEERNQVKGMQYAKKEHAGGQNIPLEISLYLVSIYFLICSVVGMLPIIFCLFRAPMLLSCSAEK